MMQLPIAHRLLTQAHPEGFSLKIPLIWPITFCLPEARLKTDSELKTKKPLNDLSKEKQRVRPHFPKHTHLHKGCNQTRSN